MTNFRTEADGWQPEFASQRAPWAPGNEYAFQPGHELSMRHGAWSDRVTGPIAEAILRDVLNDPTCNYLSAPRFAAELAAWSVAEARVRTLEIYIGKLAEKIGDESGVGDLSSEATRAAWSLLHRCEARAMSGRDRLGLSPAAAARLGRDRAAGSLDMAKLMGELHKRDQEQAGNGEDIEDD